MSLGAAAEPGSGTEPFASPPFGRCTVNGVLHFGHLMESPAGGTRLSSSSYAAGQLGHWIRIALARSSGVLESLLEQAADEMQKALQRLAHGRNSTVTDGLDGQQ